MEPSSRIMWYVLRVDYLRKSSADTVSRLAAPTQITTVHTAD